MTAKQRKECRDRRAALRADLAALPLGEGDVSTRAIAVLVELELLPCRR